jgi:hypothetical protein
MSKKTVSDIKLKAAQHVRNLTIQMSIDARNRGEDELADAYSDISSVVDDVARGKR